MTRTIRQCPITGKPLPAPPPLPDEWHEEVTRPDRVVPSTEELLSELLQHADQGTGEDDVTFHRRVL
jgi:hypothetical protein